MVEADKTGPRIAVVGVGHFGRHHARILATLPGARLVAVVDIDVDRAAAVAAETGAAPEADVAALDGRVDAVTVAVPTASHHAVALPLLERGGDLFASSCTSNSPSIVRPGSPSKFCADCWSKCR